MFWAKDSSLLKAVAKARFACGARSWTICSIARPSSPLPVRALVEDVDRELLVGAGAHRPRQVAADDVVFGSGGGRFASEPGGVVGVGEDADGEAVAAKFECFPRGVDPQLLQPLGDRRPAFAGPVGP